MKMTSLEILTKTLFFEAGSTCSMNEVLHIAWVIRNRVEGKKWFGNTYRKVCLKKWQFSCWNGKSEKDIEAIQVDGTLEWIMCQSAASYVLRAPAWHNPIPLVTHYFNPTLAFPKWGRKLIQFWPQLKLKHIFFIEK